VGDLVTKIEQLPDKPEELARLVIVNFARTQAARAALAAAEKAKMPAEQMAQIKLAVRETAELQLDAEVKLGEYFRGMDIRPGARTDRPQVNGEPRLTKTQQAASFGFDENARKRMETLAEHKDVVERVKAEARENDDIPTRTEVLRSAKIEKRNERIKAASFLADGKYRVFYADPPWAYSAGEQHGKTQQATTLETHYPTMSISEIAALPIREMAHDDAVLFLWVTSPLLFEAKAVIDGWGFKYKTSMVWDKEKHNVGHYVSVRHEFILICTRGSCTPDTAKLVDSVYHEPRTEHSHKPKYFRDLIDELYPTGRRIELFAREMTEGWDSWGNE
jgi:N6-adenosine-specific RNA methylase IME4